MASYQITKHVRDALIVQLRLAFTTDTVYTYNDDLALTKINISDITPNSALKIPSIVVSSVSGSESRYLDDDYLTETEDTIVRSTGLNTRNSIEILVTDSIMRDEIIDRVYELLKTIKEDLAERGVAVYKIDFNPERKQFIGDRWFYTSGVTITAYSEWVEETVATLKVASIKTTQTVIPLVP